MDKTLARRRLAHLITNLQRCRHQPQCTCERVAKYCVLHAVAHDVPDGDEPGFCPLPIISNTMVSTCMHVMLVVMLFNTQLLFVLAGWSVSSFYHSSVTVQNWTHVRMDFFA